MWTQRLTILITILIVYAKSEAFNITIPYITGVA